MLEHADARVARAEAVRQAVVDVFRLAHAVFHELQGGSPQRELQVVPNEARVRLLQDRRLAVQGLEHLKRIGHGVVGRRRSAAKLHVGHHVHGEERVRHQNAVGEPWRGLREHIGKNRRAARPNGAHIGAAPFQLAEAVPLSLRGFLYRLEDERAGREALVVVHDAQVRAGATRLFGRDHALIDHLLVQAVKLGPNGRVFLRVAHVGDRLHPMQRREHGSRAADHAHAHDPDDQVFHDAPLSNYNTNNTA